VAALPAVSHIARAQAYPTRPVRIVVGFPAGGVQDIIARLIAQSLSERLGRQFVVENRPSAGGNVATEAVAKAPPDGYVLVMVGPPNAINATLYDNLNFNFIRDNAAVATIVRAPNVLEVHPLIPAKTVPELIAYARPIRESSTCPPRCLTSRPSANLWRVMKPVRPMASALPRIRRQWANVCSGEDRFGSKREDLRLSKKSPVKTL
jgi:hypothetical protein